MPKPGVIITNYESVRDKIKPGDVIAFSGSGFPSDQIKKVTKSPISHVAVVLQSKVLVGGRPQLSGHINQIIESTTLNTDGGSGLAALQRYVSIALNGILSVGGVQISRLSDRIENYKGTVIWLPIAYKRRQAADWNVFFEFLTKQVGKKYDFKLIGKLLLASIPGIGGLFADKDDLAEAGMYICSQLVAAGMIAGGVVSDDMVDRDNVTPDDIVNMAIYRDNFYHLKGPQIDLPRFNTVDAGGAVSSSSEPEPAEEPAA